MKLKRKKHKIIFMFAEYVTLAENTSKGQAVLAYFPRTVSALVIFSKLIPWNLF